MGFVLRNNYFAKLIKYIKTSMGNLDSCLWENKSQLDLKISFAKSASAEKSRHPGGAEL